MRTIGILGGIGPQATIDFERRIHAVAQQKIPRHLNQGYPPLVTVFLRHPPILIEDGRTVEPLTLDPRLLDAARRLGEWADLIAIPSNTPHLFVEEIGRAAGCEVVSMIDAVMAELARRDVQPVGLLGLGLPQVYVERFSDSSIETLTASEELRRRLDAAILRVMEGSETSGDRAVAREAVDFLRENGAVVVVLGCTEIPLLLGHEADEPELVNPGQLLAEAVVTRSIAP